MMCSLAQALPSCLLSCLCAPLPEQSQPLSVSGQPNPERGPAGHSHSHSELLQISSAAHTATPAANKGPGDARVC